MARGDTPAALASLVVGKMTLKEKLGEIVLVSTHGYENVDSGVPRLCIPSLSLQDGPAGLAYGDTNVTQLPAPLGIAASFDTTLARQYGTVLGSEARGQGLDVVQGPNLNIDRVPQNGRAFEGFGEDPFLVSSMGVADIEGIQSQGELAQAKHLVAYNQETNRGALDAVVSSRTLHEIYLAPFEAAVRTGHVASVMCAYPQLNGVFQCQDPQLVQLLDQWGFSGFVRSDLGAAHDPVAALEAGVSLLKPGSVAALATSVHEGILPVPVVDAAVERVLTEMFATGLVGRQLTGTPGTPVDTLAHRQFALRAAEDSTVLLRNRGAVLPLRTARLHSVAVIGADADSAPVTAGFGSAGVVAPYTVTPVAAIRARVGTKVSVRVVDGGSTTRPYPPIPSRYLTPSVGTGHGLTLTVTPQAGVTGTLQMVDPNIAVDLRAHPSVLAVTPSAGANPPPDQAHHGLGASRSGFSPRTSLELPASWTNVSATWTGTLTPPQTGVYAFSLDGSGGAVLSLDGAPVVSDPESHVHGIWSQSVSLVAGHAYRVLLSWDPFDSTALGGPQRLIPSSLRLGWEFAGDPIASAAAAARRSSVAIVFAGDYSSEGFDRPSLSLPGDQNALIAAVAAANPRTVVVLNTGGPVTMPWLDRVAGVVEGWYPGQVDGAAIAAVLFGAVDPSGHLPVTFPVSMAASPINTPAQWPGIGLTSTYSEGLDVGYRYYNATGVKPLFPFGFGLSYTGFSLHHLSVHQTASGVTLTVRVTDFGRTAGTAVPQAYLTFPTSAGEPPDQLVAFAPVTLRAGQTTTQVLRVPSSAFRCYLGGAWTTVPGTYGIAVGQSSAVLPLRATVTVTS